MPYPYKKMDTADFDYIRSVTAPGRVKIGEEISEDYYHDEMPNYGSYPPELYVEVVSEGEISHIMKYCNEQHSGRRPRRRHRSRRRLQLQIRRRHDVRDAHEQDFPRRPPEPDRHL